MILVLFFYFWLIYGGVRIGPVFFIYLTDWSYLAWCGYLLFSAISTGVGLIRNHCYSDDSELARLVNNEEDPRQNWGATEIVSVQISRHNTGGRIAKVQWFIHKIHWVLFYLGVINALFVTLLFWIVEYGIAHDITSSQLSAVIYCYHGVNAIFALVDIFVTGIPMNCLHVVYPVVFGTVYAVFTVIFYAAGGTDPWGHRYVYSVLNWSKPVMAFGFVLLCIVIEVVLYAFVFVLYRLRVWILSRICPRENQY